MNNVKRFFVFLTLTLICFANTFSVHAQTSKTIGELNPSLKGVQTFRFVSFDGEWVEAEIQFPSTHKKQYSVLFSMHGMGRSSRRAWYDVFKGSETVERTHDITQIALNSGVAVIAIDARNHGQRKQATPLLPSILAALDEGKTEPYITMVDHTVRDYLALIKQLKTSTIFNTTDMSVTGYSMGAQIALLVAAKQPDVSRVFAMVPPAIESELAIVSPSAHATSIDKAKVVLFTANQDQYSTQADNATLFNTLATPHKYRLEFDADHLLPKHYISAFSYFWQFL